MSQFLERKDPLLRGWEFEFPAGLVFFGSKHTKLDDLKRLYPNYGFALLKQVHGKTCVTAQNDSTLEADAHFTDKLNLAMVIQTADCIPVLIRSETQILAIHAGWRGVEKNIVAESFSKLNKSSTFDIFIGPHIGPKYFEVGLDVSRQLQNALEQTKLNSKVLEDEIFLRHSDSSKKFVDLKKILYQQIYSAVKPLGPEQVRIHHLDLETFSHPELHSFRASKGQTGRLLSFIVLHGATSPLE